MILIKNWINLESFSLDRLIKENVYDNISYDKQLIIDYKIGDF